MFHLNDETPVFRYAPLPESLQRYESGRRSVWIHQARIVDVSVLFLPIQDMGHLLLAFRDQQARIVRVELQ